MSETDINPQIITELRKYTQACRRKQPYPPDTALSELQKRQRDLIVAELKACSHQRHSETREITPEQIYEPLFAKSHPGHENANPIIFLSTIPGLVAINSVLENIPSNVMPLLHEEGKLFFEKYPSLFASDFQPTCISTNFEPAQILPTASSGLFGLPKAAAHDFPAKTQFLRQSLWVNFGPKFGKGIDRYWAWDGEKLFPLEQFTITWVS